MFSGFAPNARRTPVVGLAIDTPFYTGRDMGDDHISPSSCKVPCGSFFDSFFYLSEIHLVFRKNFRYIDNRSKFFAATFIVETGSIDYLKGRTFMSYQIIKSITIKGDSVSITSAPNNVSPRTFHKWSADTYDEIYCQKGLEGFLKEFSKDVWKGDYHLSPSGSKYVKALAAALDAIYCYSPSLRHFLDDDRGSSLLASAAVKYLKTNTFSDKDFASYEALRSDPPVVLDVCSKKPVAFSYAAESVQQSREVAKAYIKQCSGKLGFQYPAHFRDDKELVMAALNGNGCIYRQIGQNLCADPDITRLAFASNLEGRSFHEHLPDLIPTSLRQDPSFIQEIIRICPQLHLHRAPEILDNRDTALVAAQVCTPVPYVFDNFRNDQLADPIFQEIMTSRCDEPESLKKLQSIYSKRGIPAPALAQPTGSLDSLIAKASAKQQEQAQQGGGEPNHQKTKDNSHKR